MDYKGVRISKETAILLNKARATLLNEKPETKATDDIVIAYALKKTIENEGKNEHKR